MGAKKRTKKITKGERTFLIVVAVIGTIVLVISIAFFISDVLNKHELQKTGVQVTGIVDAKDVHYIHAKTSTFTRRSIDYHFDVTESYERVSREEVPVTKGEYEKLSEGGPIELRYEARNPDVNAPLSSLKHLSPTYSMILVLAGVFGGIFFYSTIMRKWGRNLFESRSKNGLTALLKFLVQMLLIVGFIFASGFAAAMVVRGLDALLF